MARRSVLVESSGGIPVAPLVDVVLLLLVFFMLVSRYLPPSLNVTLPTATSAQIVDRPSLSISIDPGGQLSVESRQTDWQLLPGLLAGRDAETLVRIAADRNCDYEYVVRAMDACAGAGLTHIALETVPTAAQSGPVEPNGASAR